jgi:AsmA protein
VTLEGIRIANPAPFAGDLLTAEAFVLRYRLLPLLAGRVQVDRLALEKPVLALAMDAKGGFNYERLGGAAAKGAPATPAQAAPTAAAPLRIVMKSLAVENGSVVMNDQTKARLMAVEDIDFRSAFEVARGVAQGAGQVTIGKANFADVLFLRAVKAPLSMSKEKLTLSPIRGALAGGEVSGDLKVDLGGFRFTTDLGSRALRSDAAGVRVRRGLRHARARPTSK